MNEHDRHQRLREQLGSYALGHLPAEEADALRAHLDGCATCRAELEDLAPLAGLLDSVDPARFETPPTPPVDLGERIHARIAAERRGRAGDELRERRARGRRTVRTRLALGAAAAVLVLAAVGGGALVGRSTAPEAAPVVPLEPIAMSPVGNADLTVDSADLVAHTWGVELRIVATGFARGEMFHAAFRESSGELTPAGEFLGTGAVTMTCNLQSAALRDDVSEVVVTNDSGTPVLVAELPAPA